MKTTDCGLPDRDGIPGREQLVAFGPTILVNVGFDSAYDPGNSQAPPALQMKNLQALVDTGASLSFIDSAASRR